jgi:hypothetical protein
VESLVAGPPGLGPRKVREVILDIGVDIGKRRLAVGCPETQQSWSIDLKKPGLRGGELQKLSYWLRNIVLPGLAVPPEHVNVWVEATYVGSHVLNIATALGLAETIGVVQAAAPWRECHTIGQSTWKAGALGNGSVGKEYVALWLAENHPLLFVLCIADNAKPDQDRIDAMCIGLYGMMRSNGTIPEPAAKPKKKRKKKT